MRRRTNENVSKINKGEIIVLLQNGNSFSNEIWLIVIGAILGFLLSIVTTVVNRMIDKHGKMRIFYKMIYQKSTGQKARIAPMDGDTYLIIPLYFELQNTSNTARVVRDVCLYLYNNDKQVAKMFQVQSIQNNRTKEITSFGGEKNSYSFVLPPTSIQKQECEFWYKVQTSQIGEYSFDEIRFAYFDEKNRTMECIFCKAENGWSGVDFNYKNEDVELKCKKKK